MKAALVISERDNVATALEPLDPGRRLDLSGITVGDQQDVLEADRVARGCLEPLDDELAAELNAILLSAGFDYCVHGSPRRFRRARALIVMVENLALMRRA